jgi:hypothetical protein
MANDDLIERLDRYGFIHEGISFRHPMAQEAKNRITTLEAENAKLRGELRIGDKVEVVGEYESDWRGRPVWVAGIAVADNGTDLNITISEQWPVLPRFSYGYLGLTDGFTPEQLRRAQHGEKNDG